MYAAIETEEGVSCGARVEGQRKVGGVRQHGSKSSGVVRFVVVRRWGKET